MTTIGAAPAASIVSGSSSLVTGQVEQLSSDQAKTSPNVRERFSYSGIEASISSTYSDSGSSRQLTA